MRVFVVQALLLVLSLGAADTAQAIVIDSFSAGAFNLQGNPGVGVGGTFGCGATCLGGSREVFIIPNGGVDPAFVQLSSPPGEAQNVMPAAGGQMDFNYRAPVGGTIDLTQGGVSTDLWVTFSVFVTGASVSVELEDDTGVSQSVSQGATGPGPVTIFYSFSDYTLVDLENIVAVRVNVDAPTNGDYHPADIQVPPPSTGQVSVMWTPINPVATAPPYPMLSPAAFRAFINPDLVEVRIGFEDVRSGGGAQIPSEIAGLVDGEQLYLTQRLTLPPDPVARLFHKVAFFEPEMGTEINDPVINLDWAPGEDFFEVTTQITTNRDNPGSYTQTMFVELDPGQAGASITDVSAAPGSLLLDVEVTGVSAGPVLNTVIEGTFTSASAGNTLGASGALALALLLLAASALLARRQPTRSRS